MLTYSDLKRNQRKFLALTGLTVKEFEFLWPGFQRVDARGYPASKTRRGQTGQRQVGGGRQSALDSLEQKLLFALGYQKTYPLQAVMGALFELSQSRANRWIHALLPLLRDARADLKLLPERNPQRCARGERQKHEPAELIIDGTERRRQRPKNKDKQRLHYSGRKKMHSDKNGLIANAKTKRIGYLRQPYVGKTQDKKIADTEQIVYARDATLYKDTGFQAYEPRVRQTHQPKKSRASKN